MRVWRVFVGAAGVAVLGGVLFLSAGASAAGGSANASARSEGGPSIDDATQRWEWPVAPQRIVGPYAAPPSPYAAGHRGIDLAAVMGTTVLAPSDATVHFAGVVVDRPVLTLDHGSGILSSYEPVIAEGLKPGDPVVRGSPIGVVGVGGHCSDACLHVGVRIDGGYVSPLLFFDWVPHSVLLPLSSGSGSEAVDAGQARG
jgi:murein DD-endopeptidase MepM/ murein hydrolase activator NlpD